MQQLYVFGIGSLITESGRARTVAINQFFPAQLYRFERGWNDPVQELKMTGLGAAIAKSKKAYINGVLFPVSAEELRAFDEREGGMEKLSIFTGKFRVPNEEDVKPGSVRVYGPEIRRLPTKELPIVQSYVDVILHGILEDFGKKYGERYALEFAKEFVKTTNGWDFPWKNDRSNPAYKGHTTLTPAEEQKIDSILEEMVRNAFLQRK